MNILVIEAEKKAAGMIKKDLEKEGYKVTLCHNGPDGLALIADGEFDLVILDSTLAKMDDLAVLGELRKENSLIPVLMLSEKTEIADVVAGLETGADVYMGKPFSFDELQARISALIRRSKQSKGAVVRYADMKIDPVNHNVWRGKTEIHLSIKEYRMLIYLVNNAERTITRQEIADNCWDEPFETFTNIIDVYINYLRRKIDDEKFPSKLIHTVRGKGYILMNKLA